jgi:hypothetical protein
LFCTFVAFLANIQDFLDFTTCPDSFKRRRRMEWLNKVDEEFDRRLDTTKRRGSDSGSSSSKTGNAPPNHDSAAADHHHHHHPHRQTHSHPNISLNLRPTARISSSNSIPMHKQQAQEPQQQKGTSRSISNSVDENPQHWTTLPPVLGSSSGRDVSLPVDLDRGGSDSMSSSKETEKSSSATAKKIPQSSFWRSATTTTTSTAMNGGTEARQHQQQKDDAAIASNQIIHRLTDNASLDNSGRGESLSNSKIKHRHGDDNDQDHSQGVPTIVDTSSSLLSLQQGEMAPPLDMSISKIHAYGSKDFSDFEVTLPLPSWNTDVNNRSNNNDTLGSGLEPLSATANANNCHGVFHVRILKAQRLPCPVGSTVYASMSLPPWQGRVRTERVPAFLASLEHGVCVRWEQPQQLSNTTDPGLCSMINAWSSEESPVPSIKIELMFSPLGMGLFDFSMCSLTLGCEVLMASPETWKTQWCQATVARLTTGSGKEYTIDDRVSLMQVEAMFAPTSRILRKDSSSANLTLDDGSVATLEGMRSVPQLINGGTNDASSNSPSRHFMESSYSHLQQQQQQHPTLDISDHGHSVDDDEMTELSILKSPTGTVMTQQVPMLMNPANKQHHLRVLPFWMPGTCSVCSRIILGRLNNGFHCEICEIYCCSDCRLNVDLQIPCGSETARNIVEHSIQNKLTMGNLLSIVAPVVSLDGSAKNNPALNNNDPQRNVGFQKQSTELSSSSMTTTTAPMPRLRLVNDFDEKEPGVGCLKLEFVRACLFERPLLAESELTSVTSSLATTGRGGAGLRRGEYYARVTCSSGTKKTARTRTVQSIGTPNFGSDEMRFNV